MGGQALAPRVTSSCLRAGTTARPRPSTGPGRSRVRTTKRRATQWRCPTGECAPKSVWVKATRLRPIIPRETKRWRSLYHGRGAVEREFGRLKHEYGLSPLRVRGLAHVQLHADLTMLARVSQAFARARAVPFAA